MHNTAKRPRDRRYFRLEPMHLKEFAKKVNLLRQNLMFPKRRS